MQGDSQFNAITSDSWSEVIQSQPKMSNKPTSISQLLQIYHDLNFKK
jgi:hypothetical protein